MLRVGVKHANEHCIKILYVKNRLKKGLVKNQQYMSKILVKKTSEKSALACPKRVVYCWTRGRWYRMINVHPICCWTETHRDTGICKYRYTASNFQSLMIEITSSGMPASRAKETPPQQKQCVSNLSEKALLIGGSPSAWP